MCLPVQIWLRPSAAPCRRAHYTGIGERKKPPLQPMDMLAFRIWARTLFKNSAGLRSYQRARHEPGAEPVAIGGGAGKATRLTDALQIVCASRVRLRASSFFGH